MLSKFLDPLTRPLLIVIMGAFFGLLITAPRAFLLLPGDATRPLWLSGLIAAVGAVLFLGLATVACDTLAWLGGPADEEPSERE